MKSTFKWIDNRFIETRKLACPTAGCGQVFEVDYAIHYRSDAKSDRFQIGDAAMKGAEYDQPLIVMTYVPLSCPRCHRTDELWSTSTPAVAVRPIRGLRWHSTMAQLAHLARAAHRVIDMLEWAYGWVLRGVRRTTAGPATAGPATARRVGPGL